MKRNLYYYIYKGTEIYNTDEKIESIETKIDERITEYENEIRPEIEHYLQDALRYA